MIRDEGEGEGNDKQQSFGVIPASQLLQARNSGSLLVVNGLSKAATQPVGGCEKRRADDCKGLPTAGW